MSEQTSPERLVRKTAEQVMAEDRSEDMARLRETDQWSDEEINRRARTDPDNPPMMDEADEVIERLSGADDATLAAVLHRVADQLNERGRQKAG